MELEDRTRLDAEEEGGEEEGKEDEVDSNGEFDFGTGEGGKATLGGAPLFELIVVEVGEARLVDDVFVAADGGVHGVPPGFARGVQDGALAHEGACLAVQDQAFQ